MIRRPCLSFASLAAILIVTCAPGCKKTEQQTGQEPVAGEAVDSVDVAQNEAALVVAASDTAGAEATADQAAQAAVTAAPTAYSPKECVTAELTGKSTVLYTLDDCTGPYGLIHVTGEVTVVFSDQSDGLHAHATATGLSINGATIDLDANATYEVSGTQKTLSVTTQGKGTGPRGNSITRSGEYTATWDSGTSCFGLDGDWSTRVGVVAWDTKVAGYDRCATECPASGGSISWTGQNGKSLTVTFDGTDAAKWQTSTGKSGTVDLFCGS